MIYFLIIAFLAAVFLSLLIKHIAIKKQILDIPNERSSHSIPTPRGGGLAIAIVWYVSLVVSYVLGEIELRLFWALMSGIVLSLVSFIDDIKSLTPRLRIAAQLISAVLALCALGGASEVDFGFVQFENVYVLTALSIPFIIWFINLFNFLDGIDGFLGMEGVFIFVALWIFTGNMTLLIISSAILGFLVWNWPVPKAKIFCGDVGSTLIGFNFAVFAIYFQSSHELTIIIPMLLSALFWFDATLTLFRRWRNKEELSVAHRKHAYQRIVQAGFSHAKVLYFALAINGLLLACAIFSFRYKFFSSGILLCVILVLWMITRQIDKRQAFN